MHKFTPKPRNCSGQLPAVASEITDTTRRHQSPFVGLSGLARRQQRVLEKDRPPIIVATPGRL
jgi:superfamily II DNA/RNA helicase